MDEEKPDYVHLLREASRRGSSLHWWLPTRSAWARWIHFSFPKSPRLQEHMVQFRELQEVTAQLWPKALSEQGTPLALHWYLSAHMETNEAAISSDLPASCFPLHSPATTPGHKQNALDNLLTLQLPFYCPASSRRWVACQETQGSSDRSGTLRRGLWKPQRKREEGNTYVPFTLLSRRGCWKLGLAHDSWLEACSSWHLGYKFRLAAVLAWSLVPFWEQVQHLKFRADCWAVPQAFCSPPPGSFGPSASLSKPVALQNAALFQTILHWVYDVKISKSNKQC